MKKKTDFTVSDGDLVLHLEIAEEGRYIVTSPFEPELITEAESLEDAFDMARDAIKALRAARAKLHRKLALSKGVP
jgi:antitoxin HicB